jgi:uracil-DNA glycosylase
MNPPDPRGSPQQSVDATGGGAEAFLPAHTEDLATLRGAAAGCRGCGLYAAATQTVFGAGNDAARIMLVGEQPGDQEDRRGAPFVGPAGELLDRALQEAGLDRSRLYVTNAVKHFKWEPRGKLRLHKKPSAAETKACRPWLLAEIAAVDPHIVVCLGATAAQSLLGPAFRVTKERGNVNPGPGGCDVIATVHPSSILRTTDPDQRRREFAHFVEDLRQVAQRMARLTADKGRS